MEHGMDERALTRRHRDGGVELVERDGALTPLSFGDVDTEIAALLDGAGLCDVSAEATVVVTGRHRARFLHAMTTCQVKALAPGQGNYGLAVDRGGKLVGQFWLDCEPEAIVLSAPGPMLEALVAHFVAHRVADDVQFGPVRAAQVLALVGPLAAEVLARTGAASPGDAAYAWVDAEVAGAPARVRRNGQRLLAPGFDVTVGAEDGAASWGALVAAGAAPVGTLAFDVVRIGRGVPRDGLDMGAANIPLESQVLYDAMDWDKGCYIGQEVIAMMHYRGRPNRHLVGLRLAEGAALPAAGVEVLAEDGRAVGELGSTAMHERLGGAVALAVLKRKYADVDSVLTLAGGGDATVVALPLL
jgi:folate-binding protein YgfZ